MGYFEELRDRKVIVTGGSKGIGFEIALSFVKLGAHVIITGRDEGQLNAAVSRLQEADSRCSYIVSNVQDVNSIRQMVDEAVRRMDGLDVLVNNAGINIAKPALEVTEEDWDRVVDTNLKGTFFCSQQAGRYMVPQGSGKIINIVSQMAFVGYIKRAAYCASKGGAVQLTKALAIEWAPHHIHVNAVAPTFIESDLTAKMFADEAFKQDVLRRIPLGKLSSVADVAGAVLYLASDLANFVTGETIRVDGGWTAI